jgi:hypothetical protein
MYKVLGADFPVQQFPFNNFPLAILFPSKASHIKKPKAKAKAWHPPSGGPLYPVVNRVEQRFSGRSMAL